MSTNKLTAPMTVRFSKGFWDKVEEISELSRIPKTILVRVKVEEALDAELSRELSRLRRKYRSKNDNKNNARDTG